MLDQREALKEKKTARWEAKNTEAYEKWEMAAAKRAREGQRSRSFTKQIAKDPGLSEGIEKAEMIALVPFTTDFFDLPQSEPLIEPKEPEQPFEPLAKPTLDPYRTDYLQQLITRHE